MSSRWSVNRNEDKSTTCTWLADQPLPEGEVVIAISHSAINYKDALAVTGKGRIIRRFPCTPGIDAAGTVVSSTDERFAPGDAVFATGWGMGETHDGGLSTHVALAADHVLPIPAGWDAAAIMALGTAGLTAMQGIIRLEENGVTPASGPVAVTGATGGVAMVAIKALAGLGFEVEAVTGKAGKPEADDQLRSLGATTITDRRAFAPGDDGPMMTERYAGGIDTTGSEPLAALLRRTRRYGAVATCGVAAGNDLPMTMFPFILRGIALLGISSVEYPAAERAAAWQRLADLLEPDTLAPWTTIIGLDEVPDWSERMIAGTTTGRAVVTCS